MGRWNSWFRKRAKRGVRPAPQPPAGVFKTASRSADPGGYLEHFSGYVGLPNETPFVGILTSILREWAGMSTGCLHHPFR